MTSENKTPEKKGDFSITADLLVFVSLLPLVLGILHFLGFEVWSILFETTYWMSLAYTIMRAIGSTALLIIWHKRHTNEEVKVAVTKGREIYDDSFSFLFSTFCFIIGSILMGFPGIAISLSISALIFIYLFGKKETV